MGDLRAAQPPWFQEVPPSKATDLCAQDSASMPDGIDTRPHGGGSKGPEDFEYDHHGGHFHQDHDYIRRDAGDESWPLAALRGGG